MKELNRRAFLALSGASVAMLALAACGAPSTPPAVPTNGEEAKVLQAIKKYRAAAGVKEQITLDNGLKPAAEIVVKIAKGKMKYDEKAMEAFVKAVAGYDVPGALIGIREVSLLCTDGTETELAPLTAEWNSPQQVDSTGSFSLGEGEDWCWLDLNSGGGCQLATHNNRYFYQGAVTYLGATPDGTALGFSLIRDTDNGPEWVAFSAALQYDYINEWLILTPLSGQNPLTDDVVPLVMSRSFG